MLIEGLNRIWRPIAQRSEISVDRLPARAARLVREAEDRGENLISYLQLTIVAAFSILYMLSEGIRSFGSAIMGEFDAVPMVLMAYAIVVAAKLAWGLSKPVPDWVIALSIFIDMALLMGLIWSFHIEYEQPPSFYLKAPTVLYVFIFIAARALSFSPKWVLVAGLTAAVGWSLLLAYALYFDARGMVMPEPTITRDYVEYLTSNTILLGGEIDKIVAISAVTIILWGALVRVQDLLVHAAESQTAADELSRFFDPDLAAQIAARDEALEIGQAERRAATIVLFDLRGFTMASEQLAPQDLLDLLASYQRFVVPIIRKHGGSVDKFMGDGILVSFGAVRELSDHAARALTAIAEVMASRIAWQEDCEQNIGFKPEIGAGVAAGGVLFGAIGLEDRLEYTVIGDAVNRAAKYEKHNKAENSLALTDAATLNLAQAQGYPADHEMRTDRSVSGIGHPETLAILATVGNWVEPSVLEMIVTDSDDMSETETDSAQSAAQPDKPA
ncbi:MAG: adenylate/guanylate cyclase domain-containing protein [Alphaproteobacteria bacterium]